MSTDIPQPPSSVHQREEVTVPWTVPTDAVCIEEGCTLPAWGIRPSGEDYLLEKPGKGEQPGEYWVVKAGSFDEIVCAIHAKGLQPDGSIAE